MKKNLSRLSAIMLALVLTLSLSVTAFAADDGYVDCITIDVPGDENVVVNTQDHSTMGDTFDEDDTSDSDASDGYIDAPTLNVPESGGVIVDTPDHSTMGDTFDEDKTPVDIIPDGTTDNGHIDAPTINVPGDKNGVVDTPDYSTMDNTDDGHVDVHIINVPGNGEESVRDDVPNAYHIVPLDTYATVEIPFADVAADAWYSNYVKAAYALDLFKGTGDGFDPQGTLTIAQAITLAARTYANAHGETVPASKDGEAWYQSAYDYCVAKGVIDAKDWSADDMSADATRYEMAGILNGAADSAVLTAVKDVESVVDVPADSEYAETILTWYRAGIVSGNSTGAFEGERTITRAEVAKILCTLNGVR